MGDRGRRNADWSEEKKRINQTTTTCVFSPTITGDMNQIITVKNHWKPVAQEQMKIIPKNEMFLIWLKSDPNHTQDCWTISACWSEGLLSHLHASASIGHVRLVSSHCAAAHWKHPQCKSSIRRPKDVPHIQVCNVTLLREKKARQNGELRAKLGSKEHRVGRLGFSTPSPVTVTLIKTWKDDVTGSLMCRGR
ncbi:uncharacterized protein LOC144197144 [Stigmatopora nigra]